MNYSFIYSSTSSHSNFVNARISVLSLKRHVVARFSSLAGFGSLALASLALSYKLLFLCVKDFSVFRTIHFSLSGIQCCGVICSGGTSVNGLSDEIAATIGVLQHIGKHLQPGNREVSYVPFASYADVRVLVETLSSVALLKERKGRRHKKDELGVWDTYICDAGCPTVDVLVSMLFDTEGSLVSLGMSHHARVHGTCWPWACRQC